MVESFTILQALVGFFSDVTLKHFNKYMIILDFNRYSNDQTTYSNRYNNQSEITKEDLPEVEMLKFLKVSLHRSRAYSSNIGNIDYWFIVSN